MPEGKEVAALVAVIIVNWNTRELLQQALATLYEKTPNVSLEVVVVDNGSSDGSVDLVRDQFPDVAIVPLPENLGFAKANNIGFAHSSAPYVLLLNSDTIVLPTTVSGCVAVLDRDPTIGCVGARHLNGDGSLQRSVDSFPSLLNDALSMTELHRLGPVERFLRRRFAWWGEHDRECEVGWVNGACMMVRRTVIDAVGALDEGTFIYGEEVDWCYRMQQAGWKVVFTPNAEVIHLGGQAMDQAADRRVHLRYAGQLRFYRRHYSGAQVAALRILFTTVSSVRLLAIGGMWISERLGRPPSSPLWEFVTQERVRVPHRVIARAWARILVLR